MIQLPVRIAKVSRSDGKLRLFGIASDNRPDLYRTRMDVRLFRNFIHRRETGEFEPYLSVAHFLTPVGEIDRLYIDGRYLKIAASVDPTKSMGKALAQSLEDPEFRSQVGFSIGFQDEDYFYDNTAGGIQTYVDGLLVHVALTSIPANPRSRLLSVEMSRTRLQYEDATRLVGPVLASYLVKRDMQLRRGAGLQAASFTVRHPAPGHDQQTHAGARFSVGDGKRILAGTEIAAAEKKMKPSERVSVTIGTASGDIEKHGTVIGPNKPQSGKTGYGGYSTGSLGFVEIAWKSDQRGRAYRGGVPTGTTKITVYPAEERSFVLRHPGHQDQKAHAGSRGKGSPSGTTGPPPVPESIQGYLQRQPPERLAKLQERWTPHNEAGAKALGSLAAVPGSGTHVVDGRTFKETITVQLPKKAGGTRERLEKSIVGKTPTETRLDPRNLVATQTYISRDGIAGAINGALERPGFVREGYLTKVAKLKDGKHYIVDGHHRTHAALFIGERSMPVHLYDLSA